MRHAFLSQKQSLFCLKLFICETGRAHLQPWHEVHTSGIWDLLMYCYSLVSLWPKYLQNHLDKHRSNDYFSFVSKTGKYSSAKCQSHKVMRVSFSVSPFFFNITSSLIFFYIKFVIFTSFLCNHHHWCSPVPKKFALARYLWMATNSQLQDERMGFSSIYKCSDPAYLNSSHLSPPLQNC